MIVDINCANCTHSWETNTLTDPDPYLCHKCGLDNQTMKFEPEKLEAWKKSQMKEEKIPGGKAEGLSLMDVAKYHKMPLKSIKVKLDQGIKTEMEHTTDRSIAREIAIDHIYEDPNYYSKLKKLETEGSCGYDIDVDTGAKLKTPGGLEEDGQKTSDKNMDDYKKQNNPSGKVKDPFGLNQYARELAMGLEEADPKKGTGKKPEGSGRRLYTDEDPKDTVRVKFKTKEDIVDTLNKTSFKAKSHARQSQVINLIHQRVRAAYGKSKDPEVKARLKRALDYIEKRKEASKKKTERLHKMKEASNPEAGTALPYGSGFTPVKESYQFKISDKNYDSEDNSLITVEYKFSTPDNTYRVEFYSGEYNPESKTFDVSFGLDKGYSSKLDTFQMTGENNALNILKTIVNIIIDFTDKFEVNKLVINPTSEKRGKVYSMILKSLPSNILNKIELINEKSNDPFDSGYKELKEKNGFGGQSRYRAIEKRGDKYYYIQDNPFAPGIRQEFGPYKTKEQAKKKMETFPPAQNYRDITENDSMELSKNLENLIPELVKFMGENGLEIQPLPKIKFITDDEVNANDPLGITAFYDPANVTIVLYTMGRHVKDILRSLAHEMVHHEQNLNKTIGTGKIKTTNTLEDDYLDKIEREAYEKGNIIFRNWTDSLKK